MRGYPDRFSDEVAGHFQQLLAATSEAITPLLLRNSHHHNLPTVGLPRCNTPTSKGSVLFYNPMIKKSKESVLQSNDEQTLILTLQ
jgi:hypothetical protein